MMQATTRETLAIAIDFGTTFSGIFLVGFGRPLSF
jgi:hypothetical protein